MRRYTSFVFAFALSLATLSLGPTASAQPTPTAQLAPSAKELKLTVLGGAVLQVPEWREVRKDEAVAVFEQTPDPSAQKPFYVLVCTLEAGPATGAPIDWDKVKDNIIQSASRNGRALTLKLGEAFGEGAGFEGRRLAGEFVGANGKKVAMELVALVKDARLLTIGLISETSGQAEKDLVAQVARSSRLGL